MLSLIKNLVKVLKISKAIEFRKIFTVAGLLNLRAMVVEVFSAIIIKLFDAKASPMQRNLLFFALISIFLFIIASLATLTTFLRITLE